MSDYRFVHIVSINIIKAHIANLVLLKTNLRVKHARDGSPAVPGGQRQCARCSRGSHNAPAPHAPAHAVVQRPPTHASASPHCVSDVHAPLVTSEHRYTL